MVLKLSKRKRKLKLSAKFQKKGNRLEKLEKHLRKLKGEILTGYFDGEVHEDSGLTLATLMAKHENGTDTLPSRPVMTIGSLDFIKINPIEFKRLTGKLIREVGKVDKNYNLIGTALRDNIKGFFGDNTVLASNSEVTIKMKDGRDEPLVDTGELRDNLGFKTSKDSGINK